MRVISLFLFGYGCDDDVDDDDNDEIFENEGSYILASVHKNER